MKIFTTLINEPGRICGYGVEFQEIGDMTAPYLCHLEFNEDSVRWVRGSAMMPVNGHLSDVQKQELADNALRSLMNYRQKTRRPFKQGDRVWCKKLRQKGIIENIDGDNAIVSLNEFMKLTIPLNELTHDRKR